MKRKLNCPRCGAASSSCPAPVKKRSKELYFPAPLLRVNGDYGMVPFVPQVRKYGASAQNEAV